jgi:simple sugar transport system ATP-binding protein
VDFRLRAGEVHALMGQNGAGKSTLIKVLTGVYPPDRGELRLHGAPIQPASPAAAQRLGISTVYQEVNLCPNLSVAENIFAGRYPRRGAAGLWRIDWPRMNADARALLERLQLRIDVTRLLSSYSVAVQQMVAIARALSVSARVLVLDEPTSSLDEEEVRQLFGVMRRLRDEGMAILFVTHFLDQMYAVSDRITVLRDGQHIGTFDKSRTSPPEIVRAMVGRDLETLAQPPAPPSPAVEAPLLEVSGLTCRPWFEDISLTVRAGEIVGLFGLVGSGRSEMLETLFGLHRADRGSVRLEGRPVRFASPVEAVRAGLALVPEERHRQGLFFNLSVRDNLLLPAENAGVRWRRDRGREGATSLRLVEQWRIKTPAVEAPPDRLSGGNQQKVVLAKWLHTAPRLLLLDEPTKGVDVGAKWEIHDIVRRQAASGTGCLVVSSDLPEVLALAQRIVVLREGRMQGELPGGSDEETVMRLATAVGHASVA